MNLIEFTKSETGRRMWTWALGALGLAAQGGLLPIDMPIPVLNVSLGQLLMFLGVSVAATAGSQTRR